MRAKSHLATRLESRQGSGVAVSRTTPMRASLLLGLVLQVHAAWAWPAVEPGTGADIDAVAPEWLSETGAPSVSIAIVRGGRLEYAKAYGHARIEPARPATLATRYPIDSISKQFTAAAVLILGEQGKLSLDEPIGRWLPGLGAAARVTLRQVLTHTSGIRDYWPQDFLPSQMTRPTTPAAILEEWVKRPLDFAPGFRTLAYVERD